jgi:hypothetical protein
MVDKKVVIFPFSQIAINISIESMDDHVYGQ